MKNDISAFVIEVSMIIAMFSACNPQSTQINAPVLPTFQTTLDSAAYATQGNTPVLPTAQSTKDAAAIGLSAPLWRFGVSLARAPLSAYDAYGIASMRFGWYVDYSVNPGAPTPYGMEYMPMVRVKQLKQDGSSKSKCCVACGYVVPYEYSVSPGIDQIQAVAAKHPGMAWIIGNEMDRVDFGSGYCSRQDEMLPELYAQVYHELYFAIKSADHTAQVVIGGVSEITPLRIQYLLRVLTEYSRLYGLPMPVDIWNIHVYVLQEVKGSYGADIPTGFRKTSGVGYTILDNKDFSKAWAQIVSFRIWMKNHRQQEKPLIISEYGVSYPAWVDNQCPDYPDTTDCPLSPEQVRDDFMFPSFDAFLNQTDANIGYLIRWKSPGSTLELVQR